MTQEIETEKWRIFFKKPFDEPLNESYIELILRLKSDPNGLKGIRQEELEELSNDLLDLGKWRKFRELKKDLEK